MTRLIAITGKIGSGKSTVGRILSEKGYPVVDCDTINRDLLCDPAYLKGLRALFPNAFPNAELNKKILSSIVFSDASARRKLNEYAHGKIFEEAFLQAKKFDGLVFIEVPVLFGTGYEDTFEKIIVVSSDEEKSVERIALRDDRDRKESKAILAAQRYDIPSDLPIVYLKNDGSISDLTQAVDALLCEIE